MNPQKSVMRNPTSKATISTKQKLKSKGSLADKSRQTFATATVNSRK